VKIRSAFRTAVTVLGFKAKRQKILSVDYLLTSRCNLRCSFCLRPSLSSELSTQKALKVVDESCRLAPPLFHFSGGEPLLRKDLPVLANRASDEGCIVGLSTNGTLFNRSKAEKIARVFDRIGISIDGFQQIHDKYRGMGTFKKAVQAIKWLKSFGAEVGVYVIIAPWNIEVVPNFIEWLRNEVRVNFVLVQPVHPYPPPSENRPLHEAVLRLSNYLVRLKRTDPNFLVVPMNFIKGIESFFDGKVPKICHAAELYIAIDPLGNLLACPGRSDIVLGNILDTPINEILNDKTNTSDWFKVETCQGCWLNCTTQASMIVSISYTEVLHLISGLMKVKLRARASYRSDFQKGY